MKTVRLTLLAALLVFFPSIASHATGICQMEYRYSCEGIALDGARRLAFVACDDSCTVAPNLMPAPKSPTLSLRLSRDVATGESPQEWPVSAWGEIIAKPEIHESPNNPGTHEKSSGPPVAAPPSADSAAHGASVLFALNGFTLSDAETTKLSSFVTRIRAETKGGSVSVEGYTCDLGSKRSNDVLARKRAEAVASYLEKAGMYPARITGVGKCCYVIEDPGKRYLNRRVEIKISGGAP